MSINAGPQTEHSHQLPHSGGRCGWAFCARKWLKKVQNLRHLPGARSKGPHSLPCPKELGFILREERQESFKQWVTGTIRCWRRTLVWLLVWKLTWQERGQSQWG